MELPILKPKKKDIKKKKKEMGEKEANSMNYQPL